MLRFLRLSSTAYLLFSLGVLSAPVAHAMSCSDLRTADLAKDELILSLEGIEKRLRGNNKETDRYLEDPRLFKQALGLLFPHRDISLFTRYLMEPQISDLWWNAADVFIQAVSRYRSRLSIRSLTDLSIHVPDHLTNYDPYTDFVGAFAHVERVYREIEKNSGSIENQAQQKDLLVFRTATLIDLESRARLHFQGLGSKIESPMAFMERQRRISKIGFTGDAKGFLEELSNAAEINYSHKWIKQEAPRTFITERTDIGKFVIRFPFLIPLGRNSKTEGTDHFVSINHLKSGIVTAVDAFLQQYKSEAFMHGRRRQSSSMRLQSMGGFFLSELLSQKENNLAIRLLKAGVTMSGDFNGIFRGDPMGGDLRKRAISIIHKLQIVDTPGLVPLRTQSEQVQWISGVILP